MAPHFFAQEATTTKTTRMEFTSEPGVQDTAPFSVTMEVEEDIEQEIENFVRFKRRGEYSQAQEIFQQTLCRHLSLFPVIAEYADLLLEEGKFQILSEFLDIQIQYMESILEAEEVELLRIMRSLVAIHTQGSLRSALIQAKNTWDFLCRGNTKLPPGTLPGDVEVGFGYPVAYWASRELSLYIDTIFVETDPYL